MVNGNLRAIEFSFDTKTGVNPNKPMKVNQDSYVTLPNYLGDNKNYFFAVCDGHGTNGHHASGFIKHKLPRKLN